MAEVIRCSECGTPFKGVPVWLTTAKVNFTCTSCPKKGTRGTLTRFEPVVESHPSISLDGDLDDVDIEALDEDPDIDLGDDDLDTLGDDKDL
jgi:hypothetical protein